MNVRWLTAVCGFIYLGVAQAQALSFAPGVYALFGDMAMRNA